MFHVFFFTVFRMTFNVILHRMLHVMFSVILQGRLGMIFM
jgi:hypothetical protein